jgi:hypothetical protein
MNDKHRVVLTTPPRTTASTESQPTTLRNPQQQLLQQPSLLLSPALSGAGGAGDGAGVDPGASVGGPPSVPDFPGRCLRPPWSPASFATSSCGMGAGEGAAAGTGVSISGFNAVPSPLEAGDPGLGGPEEPPPTVGTKSSGLKVALSPSPSPTGAVGFFCLAAFSCTQHTWSEIRTTGALTQ